MNFNYSLKLSAVISKDTGYLQNIHLKVCSKRDQEKPRVSMLYKAQNRPIQIWLFCEAEF